MNIFKKIGNAFGWVGKKALWVIRRKETLFAISLTSDILPIPALDKIILLVRSLDRKNVSGYEKMALALEKAQPILKEYGLEIKDESDLRLLLELAVSMMKKKSRVIPKE